MARPVLSSWCAASGLKDAMGVMLSLRANTPARVRSGLTLTPRAHRPAVSTASRSPVVRSHPTAAFKPGGAPAERRFGVQARGAALVRGHTGHYLLNVDPHVHADHGPDRCWRPDRQARLGAHSLPPRQERRRGDRVYGGHCCASPSSGNNGSRTTGACRGRTILSTQWGGADVQPLLARWFGV